MARLRARQVAAIKSKLSGPQLPALGQSGPAGDMEPPMPMGPALATAAIPQTTMRNDLPIRGGRAGARDGLGRGKGGLALHGSMSGADVMGRTVAHSSKLR